MPYAQRRATDRLLGAWVRAVAERMPSMYLLRVALIAFGIDTVFSVMVPYVCQRLFTVAGESDRQAVFVLFALCYVAKTIILIPVFIHYLTPIERWLRAGGRIGGRAGDGAPPRTMSDELILDAGRAAYDTPIRFSLVWALAWAAVFLVATLLLQLTHPSALAGVHAPFVEALLISCACFAAALPLGYSILGRLFLDVAGALSLAAGKRGLLLRGHVHSLGLRLVLLSVCLVLAPTCWMSALAVSEVAGPMSGHAWGTLIAFAFVAVVWAPVCAGFLAGVVADPFRRVGSVIAEIARRGNVDELDRVPVYFRDEIGALSDGVNAMIDRLQASAAELRRYIVELEQLDRAKDQFLRVAAHELKTPVTVMKGYTLVLLRNANHPPEEQREMLQAIERGAERMQAIVERLLAITQVGLDQIQLKSERVDIGRLVADVVERAAVSGRHRLRYLGHNSLASPASLASPPLIVMGDERRLREVLAILIENAVAYTPGGGDIDVTLSAGTLDRRGEAVVAVHDPGVGIPRDRQPRIFELFYRAHTDTPYDYNGMGVGLYFASWLVVRQRGHMWFESEEGRGSTFSFGLPLVGASAPLVKDRDAREPAR